MLSLKRILIIVCSILACAAMAVVLSMSAGTKDQGTAAQQIGPKIEHIRTIDISFVGRESWVKKLTFSPDCRYLAIVEDPDITTSTIIIWDLKMNREQARIVGLPSFGDMPQSELLWSPDGKSITYGGGHPMKFWDPMTGAIIKELNIDCKDVWSRYNRDGTMLLVDKGITLNNEGFRVYNTNDWTYMDYNNDGISIRTMSWTADDLVMVAGTGSGTEKEQIIDNKKIYPFDIVIRLIDPAGAVAPRSVVVPAIPPDAPGKWPRQAMGLLSSSISYATNKVVIENNIVDSRSLEIFQYYSDDDVHTGKIPATLEPLFSPDGKYIYLLGRNMAGTAKSLVVEASSGKSLTVFPGGHGGIAVSADGKILAVGNGRSVDIYAVK